MADFGTPVATNIQAPDPTKNLAGWMGLKQQQQALQSGAIQIEQQQQNLQKGAAATQMEQQSAQQRQGIAGIDWSKYDDGTGAISTDKMLSDTELQKRVGDQFPQILQQAAQARTQQMGNKQALVNLNNGLRDQFGSVIGALRTDPDVIADNPTGRQKVTNAITQFGQAGGPDAQKVASIYAPVAQHAPQGGLARGINAIQLQAMDASRQAGAQNPNFVNTGGNLQQTNPQAAGGNLTGQSSIANTVAPATHTFTDQAGNTWAYDPRNPGQAIQVGQGGATGTAQQTGTPTFKVQLPTGEVFQGSAQQAQEKMKQLAESGDYRSAAEIQRVYQAGIGDATKNQGSSATTSSAQPPSLSVGEADQVKANTQAVTANRQQSQDAQLQRDILGRIQSLAATPGLYVGPGSRQMADLATTISQIPGFEGAAKYANNYNELTKFMAQNAARQGASMGLSGSDARLDMATHAQPNADPMDPRTVQNVAQYMSGVVRMGLAKADAMDKWLQEPGNSLQNEHQFERLWRDNADPRLFQLAEMKDQGEASNYAKLHIRPSEQKALQQKHDVLQQLGAF